MRFHRHCAIVGCCLLAAAGVFFAAGCRTPLSMEDRQKEILASYREHVSATVADEGRAAKLEDLGERVISQFRADMAELNALADRFNQLNRDYDSTREEMEEVWAAIQKQRLKIRESLLLARAEAVSLTTPEEWEQLMRREKTLMSLLRENPGVL